MCQMTLLFFSYVFDSVFGQKKKATRNKRMTSLYSVYHVFCGFFPGMFQRPKPLLL